MQVARAARLWAGPGQPLAAERLPADNDADLVAVDIDVAGADAVSPGNGATGRRNGGLRPRVSPRRSSDEYTNWTNARVRVTMN